MILHFSWFGEGVLSVVLNLRIVMGLSCWCFFSYVLNFITVEFESP